MKKFYGHNFPHKNGPHDHAPRGYRLLVQIFEKPDQFSRPDWPMEVVERIFRRSDAVFVKGGYRNPANRPGWSFVPDAWMAFVKI